MRLPLAASLALALALALAACGDDRAPATSADGVFATLTSAGLAPESVTDLDGATLGGGACKRGTVAKLEVTACTHPDAAAATKAQPRGLAAVGETTGVALARGPVLLVVADRAAADPSGKTIDKIARTFLGEPATAAR